VKRKLSLIVFALVAAIALLSGCSSATLDSDSVSDKTPSGEKSKWAVYWYGCGSDLESEGGAATTDIEEMMSASLGSDVKVVLETGGAKSWNNDVVNAKKIQRWEVSKDGMSKVDELPQADMGDPETLSSFLSFCKKNYPAEHTMLMFWDHGGGSVSGVCFDENYDYDSLTLSELDSAIGSAWGTSQKFDIIGMDTCLMATLDNANIMKKYANYLVASEETEPGNGWQYTGWLTKLGENPSISAADLGKSICDTYKSGCDDEGTGDDITLSVIDLSKVDPLVAAVNNMGAEVLTSAAKNVKVIGQFGRSAKSAENYGGNNDEDGYTNMVDLGDLMKNADKVIPSTDTTVVNALKSAVVYKINGEYRSNSSGLSTYYSYDGDTDNLNAYASIAASPNYTKFMQYSLGEDVSTDVQQTTGVAAPQTVQSYAQPATLSVDKNGYINLQLDANTLDSVNSVTFNLMYNDKKNNVQVLMGNDNDITANWDTGLFKDNFRGVWGSMDGEMAYMELSEEGSDYNLYTVPIKLNGKETNLSVSYDFDKEKFTILGVNAGIDPNTGMASRDLTKLTKGDKIVLITYTQPLGDNNAAKTKKESKEITYSGKNQFEEMDLKDGTYTYNFVVKDTTGKTTNSNPATLTLKDGDITAALK